MFLLVIRETVRGSLLTNKLMSQGFQMSRLQAAFCKFYGRYNELIYPYNLPWATCCLIYFITIVKSFLTLILTTVYTVYLIWKKGSQRVWSIDRGCLPLHDIWSHLWYIQRSVYAHSLNCISYRTCEIEYCSLFLSFHVCSLVYFIQFKSFWWDRKNRGPVSQQVWHDKDPSLLKGPKRRA
jgi:hypothetical protein